MIDYVIKTFARNKQAFAYLNESIYKLEFFEAQNGVF